MSTTTPHWPALLSDQQASDYMSVSRTTFWKFASNPDFPRPVKLPGDIRATRFRRADLDQWIQDLDQRDGD